MTARRNWAAVSALSIWTAGATALAVWTVIAAAQGPGFGPGFGGGFGFRGPAKVVTGQPYAATVKSTSVDTLADGTTITHASTGTEARDTAGRTMHENAPEATDHAAPPPARTTVFDPVAKTITSWSTASKVATVMTIPEPHGDHGPGGPHGDHVRPEVKRETLTGKSIAGTYAEGVKITTTIPAGAEGNDKPLVSVREIWTSPDLKIVLLETSDDPRSGFHKTEVTELTRAEPDPSVFAPPAGYTTKTAGRGRRGE